MKALLYKEFKLAMHPICYIFVVVFPFMILIPNYPLAISFIYVLSCYPILFLGANKGQQSNDLLYSTLLPIRKKDIVLARIITISILQITTIVISSCLIPLSNIIQETIQEQGGITNQGLTLDGYLSIIGFTLLGYGLTDLIFFPIYYKKGRSIVLSTLLSILFFVIFICFFTIIYPLIDSGFLDLMCNSGIVPQLVVFAIGLICYLISRFINYKISSKLLEKVDF